MNAYVVDPEIFRQTEREILEKQEREKPQHDALLVEMLDAAMDREKARLHQEFMANFRRRAK